MKNKKLTISLGTILGFGGGLISTTFISCSKKDEKKTLSKDEIKLIIKETINEVIDSKIDTDIQILIAKIISFIKQTFDSNYKNSEIMDIFN